MIYWGTLVKKLYVIQLCGKAVRNVYVYRQSFRITPIKISLQLYIA